MNAPQTYWDILYYAVILLWKFYGKFKVALGVQTFGPLCIDHCVISCLDHMMDASDFPVHPTSGCPSPHQLVEVDAGSPADKAGLKTCDFIVEVCFYV